MFASVDLTSLLRTDAITRDDASDAERRARTFRRRVERAYRSGKVRRRAVDHLGMITRAQRKMYIRELKDVLAGCLRHGLTEEDVTTFRRFVWTWFRKGAPIDPQCCGLPSPSLQIVIRQVACAFPTLGTYHADARLWLTDPLIRSGGNPIAGPIKNPRAFTEFWVPFNLTLWAPAGTPYASYNRVGVTREWIDDPA